MGNRAYRRFKNIIWGTLCAFNALGCLICWAITYKFSVFHADGVLLLVMILVSILLIVQIYRKKIEKVANQSLAGRNSVFVGRIPMFGGRIMIFELKKSYLKSTFQAAT